VQRHIANDITTISWREQSHLLIIRGIIKQFKDANLNILLAKAPIISTELIPNHSMGEGEVLIIKYLSKFSYTEAESAFREIPLYSLHHLRKEFLQLLKHHPMSGHLRKIKSHRQSRLTPEGLIAPHK
jgi:hypothetical protein